MGNCLKTQLKENVANNNIRKMDEFPVYFNNASNVLFGGKYVINYQESPITYRLGDGLTAVATERPHVFQISGTGVLFVPQKQYINILQCETTDGCNMKYEDLKYLDTLNTYSTTGNCTDMTTNQLNDLKNLKQITTSKWRKLTGSINSFYFQSSPLRTLDISAAENVTGDIKYLGRFSILNNIRITNTKITGSIEDFVAVCRGMGGRTSGTVTFQNGNYTHITFNGKQCAGASASDTIFWDANRIDYAGGHSNDSRVINNLD